jgi:hypothetical protein
LNWVSPVETNRIYCVLYSFKSLLNSSIMRHED